MFHENMSVTFERDPRSPNPEQLCGTIIQCRRYFAIVWVNGLLNGNLVSVDYENILAWGE